MRKQQHNKNSLRNKYYKKQNYVKDISSGINVSSQKFSASKQFLKIHTENTLQKSEFASSFNQQTAIGSSLFM